MIVIYSNNKGLKKNPNFDLHSSEKKRVNFNFPKDK